jgi:probable addiction module antidote protein
MKTTYAPFNAADYLDNENVIAEYLSAAVEDSDPEVFLAALGDVAEARRRGWFTKEPVSPPG